MTDTQGIIHTGLRRVKQLHKVILDISVTKAFVSDKTDKYVEGCVYMHIHVKTIFGHQMIGAQTDESKGKETSGKIRKMLSVEVPC